jgi:hypothetical protein
VLRWPTFFLRVLTKRRYRETYLPPILRCLEVIRFGFERENVPRENEVMKMHRMSPFRLNVGEQSIRSVELISPFPSKSMTTTYWDLESWRIHSQFLDLGISTSSGSEQGRLVGLYCESCIAAANLKNEGTDYGQTLQTAQLVIVPFCLTALTPASLDSNLSVPKLCQVPTGTVDY